MKTKIEVFDANLIHRRYPLNLNEGIRREIAKAGFDMSRPYEIKAEPTRYSHNITVTQVTLPFPTDMMGFIHE